MRRLALALAVAILAGVAAPVSAQLPRAPFAPGWGARRGAPLPPPAARGGYRWVVSPLAGFPPLPPLVPAPRHDSIGPLGAPSFPQGVTFTRDPRVPLAPIPPNRRVLPSDAGDRAEVTGWGEFSRGTPCPAGALCGNVQQRRVEVPRDPATRGAVTWCALAGSCGATPARTILRAQVPETSVRAEAEIGPTRSIVRAEATGGIGMPPGGDSTRVNRVVEVLMTEASRGPARPPPPEVVTATRTAVRGALMVRPGVKIEISSRKVKP